MIEDLVTLGCHRVFPRDDRKARVRERLERNVGWARQDNRMGPWFDQNSGREQGQTKLVHQAELEMDRSRNNPCTISEPSWNTKPSWQWTE